MSYQTQPLPFKKELIGISEKTLTIHHDKLYAGYVAKKNEIEKKLQDADNASANQTFSELRALKADETFAANGVYLHEGYFDVLGGDGKASGELVDALVKSFGSVETFQMRFKACGMAARGWAVLAWDTTDQQLHIYTSDAHNQGGVWGAVPLIILDVYEHAYFMDYGADRGAYIDDFFKNLDWVAANKKFAPYSTR